MLTLNKDNVLTGSLIISKQQTCVEVCIENAKDNIFFFTINNGEDVCQTQELKQIESTTYACLISYNTLLDNANGLYVAHIEVGDGNDWILSNDIPIKFNRPKILGEVASANMTELCSIKKGLASLQQQIELAFSGRVPKSIPDFQLRNCKKGMVPTVISDDGHIAFTYPFSDILNEINGKKSVMRKIVLDTNDIKLHEEETNLDDLIKTLRTNQKKESQILTGILSSVSELTAKVAQLEAVLIDFKNNQ